MRWCSDSPTDVVDTQYVFGGGGDSDERRDGVGGKELRGSSSRDFGGLRVGSDDGEGLERFGERVGSKGKYRSVVLEKDDCVGGGTSKKLREKRYVESGSCVQSRPRCQQNLSTAHISKLRGVDRFLWSVEGDSRELSSPDEFEDLREGQSKRQRCVALQ